MNRKDIIFLIGFMGSGKSTLGRKLAEMLNYNYLDTDALIEEMEGKTISDIFENEGEEYFRKKEKEILSQVILKENIVVATGGGLPCFFDNMEIIQSNGLSFFLEITPKDLLERLRGETEKRPLLSNKKEKELLEWMELMLDERNIFYSKATFTIDGSLSLDELSKRILNKIHSYEG